MPASVTNLTGKVAVVTGANSGLGLETAAALAGAGAHVILAVRNLAAGNAAAEAIRARHPGASAEVGPALDLADQGSVRKFAAAMNARQGDIHVLVCNAGVGFLRKAFTEDKVGVLAQVNTLGHYTLLRLLEAKLVAGSARVVVLGSIAHRTAVIRSARDFLTVWRSGLYEHAKLANVSLAFEAQRRLGARGVTVAVADPGAVASAIWEHSPRYKAGWRRKMIEWLYAPTSDGAVSVIHAALVPWEEDKKQKKGGEGRPLLPHEDLRYYSRGAFCWPLLTHLEGTPPKGLGYIRYGIWGVHALLASSLDYPVRRATGGLLCGRTRAVRPARLATSPRLGKDLWETCAEFAGVPSAVQA